MWEAYDMENEDLLWAGVPFVGGIAGQQAGPCGAVSSATVFLGLKHRCSIADEEACKKARGSARAEANELVKRFNDTFDAIACDELVGVDFSNPDEAKRFWESGGFEKKCDKYVAFVVEQLYDFQQRKMDQPT